MTTDSTTLLAEAATDARNGARFQIAAVVIACIAAALLIARSDAGLMPVVEIGAGYGLGILAIVVILLLVQFIWTRLRQRQQSDSAANSDPMAWYRAYFAEMRWGDIVISLLALVVTVTSFTVYKGSVVGANGYGYDALFIAWDRAFFAGNDPWVLTHALFPSATMTKMLDILYHPTFFPMVVGYIICIATRGKPALRYTYMIAYLASFVLIGMISAGALHSAGPVYDGALFGDGQTFAPLMERLVAQNEAAGPFSAVFAQGYLLRLNELDLAGLGGGISAMPSMHIVLAFLWVFAAWHLHRIIGIVVTLYAIVIWFASVHLGWHYFVDGLVSVVMLAVIWYITGRAFGLYGRA